MTIDWLGRQWEVDDRRGVKQPLAFVLRSGGLVMNVYRDDWQSARVAELVDREETTA